MILCEGWPLRTCIPAIRSQEIRSSIPMPFHYRKHIPLSVSLSILSLSLSLSLSLISYTKSMSKIENTSVYFLGVSFCFYLVCTTTGLSKEHTNNSPKVEQSDQELGSEDWKQTGNAKSTHAAMPHRAARREMHARTHTRHQIFKCNSLLLQGCTIFFFESILVMTWLFVRYHCDSGAFLAQSSQRWKVGNTNEGAYRLPVGHGATRSGETGRSPLRGSRILTQCERSHEKTPCESTQRSQPASFAIFWASDGWSRLTRRIPPNDASIVEYRGASDIRTPPATSKILLKNQWS